MERIAPLAKILAEANGIEWEHLHGTGAGGQIVEQDILDYLTRVMSGEAEPPSTPVDAPPPDWNGEDIPGAGMFDVSALSKAGVDSDITDFVQQGRPAGANAAASVEVPGTPVAPALATDDFELDDAPEVAPEPTPAPVVPAPAFSAPAVAAPSVSAPQVSAPAATPAPELGVAGAAVAAGGAAVGGAAAGGLGNLLSRLYQKEENAETTAPVVVAPEMTPPAAPAFEAPRVEAPASAPFAGFGTPAAPVIAAPVTEVAPASVAFSPAPIQPAPVQPTPVEAAPVQPAPVEPAPAPAPVPAPVEAAPVHAPAPEVHAEVTRTEDRIAVPVAPAVAPAPAPMAPAVSASRSAEVPQNALWSGTYLRRNTNVAGLDDLRVQLNEALDTDVPMGLLVARAAQRHLDKLGLSTVAMSDSSGDAQSIGEGSLRDALSATSAGFNGTPDLLVVDAGAHDLDELHYPQTLTLSLGRLEDGRAGLSLQGEADQAKAAQFLVAVAQTLEKPVILLV